MEGRRKILIADHFDFDIQEIRKALIAEGYEVRIAQNGMDIFNYLESFKPDLLIVEVKLPDLNIVELIQQLRSSETGKTVPVLAASNPRTIDERISILELDVDDFIYKPFEVEEVLARLEILLKEAQQASERNKTASPGFSGSLSEMSLVDLLQTLEVGKKTAVLTLQKGGRDGKVYIIEGEVVDAEIKGLDPKKALLRMFTWNEGQFSVSMSHHGRSKQVFVDTRDLISEGVTRLYRWEQLSRQIPSLQSIVLSAPGKNESQFTADEKKIIQLINGKRRFIDLIEESPFDDIKALRLLKTLFKKGKIVEAPIQNGVLTEDYLGKFRTPSANGHSKIEALEGIFTSFFRQPYTIDHNLNDRRRIERRRGERRRFDRRRGFERAEHRIFLNKSELILVREKLLAGIKNHQPSRAKD